MTRVGSHDFDSERYDAAGDVLYLSRSDAQESVETFATPEGHAVRMDRGGDIVGLTIVNAKWLLDRDGKIVLTMPERVELPRGVVEAAIA